MEPAPSILHAIAALLLVLGLISLVAWAVKRFAFGGNLLRVSANKAEKQLHVLDSLWLDARYRVVVVKNGAESHTLLLGPQQALQLNTAQLDTLQQRAKPTGLDNNA